MMSVVNARSCILLCVALAIPSHSSAINSSPMGKVVTLLKNLSEKIAAEGTREAAEYDKYACFCKEQADEKQYAIDKSNEKIKYLKAEIDELQTAKAELDSDISALNNNIAELEQQIDRKTNKRARQHDEYLAVAQDMNEAINACDDAIDAMKSSKKSMKGAKLDLTQVTSGLVKVVQRQALLTSAPGAVALLSKLDDTKGAPKFQYHSNDIIATLEDLSDTFKKQKSRTDIDEVNANSDFEKVRLGLAHDKQFAEEEKAEKESNSEAKAEALAESSGNKNSETEDHDADKTFVRRLSFECQEKAKVFDQRSQKRTEEMTALTQATAELESGAVPNYKGNKELVGLQMSAVGRKIEKPISLVQVSNAQHQASREDSSLERVHTFLNDAADRTGSGALSAVAVRVGLAAVSKGGADHFVKVRALIKDLMRKLRADALSEHNQKADCDKGIKKATADRDDAHAAIEKATGTLLIHNSKQAALEASDLELNAQIAELKKAILEATELAAENKKTLEDQIDMCDAGASSVKLALTLLEGFYSTALLQKAPTPPPSRHVKSRDGDTVGDLAPDTSFDSEYHGGQSESKGIIGILEVILTDFETSSSQATIELTASAKDTAEFKKDCDADVTAKTKMRDVTNKAALAGVKQKIIDEESDLHEAEGILESSTAALEGWHAMCVKGEETYEERTQKRNEEIEALKEALDLLNDWKN